MVTKSISNNLYKFFSGKTRVRTSAILKKRRRSLVVEGLEDRRLMAALTPGNLVVLQSEVNATTTSNAAAVTLKEIAPDGSLVQTLTVPSTGSSSALTIRGSSTTEGILSISPDGSLVTFLGHRADAGTTNPNTQAVDRVIGKLNVATGNVDTAQQVSGVFLTNSPRSAVSNGTGFWLSGAGTGGGVQYVANGTATTATAIAGTNSRQVQIAGGNLYVSGGAANPGLSVFQLGTGLPSAAVTTPTASFTAVGTGDQYNSFYLADLSPTVGWNGTSIDTIYAVNTGTGSNLYKFSFSGTTWSNVGSSTIASLQNIAGFTTGTDVQLWGTTNTTSTGTVQTLTDTSGYGGTLTASFAPLTNPVTADTSTGFRGIVRVGPNQIQSANQSVVAVSALSSVKAEGNSGTTPFTFTVSRSGVTTGTSTVNWAVSGTGTNPAIAADFQGGVFPSGTITFNPNDTTPQTITVNVIADTAIELDEDFVVTLSSPNSGTILGTSTASGTILNDDVIQSLAPGDIVITGFNATNPDQFSFVPLVNLAAGNVLKFTDAAWTGSALSGEGTITITIGAGGLAAGTKVIVDATSNVAPTASPAVGTLTGTSGFALNASGENLFLFVGASTSPQFVYGLTSTGAYLTTGTTTASDTYLPSTLAVGVSAVEPLGDSLPTPTVVANSQYNNAVLTGTPSAIRAAVGLKANWTSSTTALVLSPTNFTPSNPSATITNRQVFYNNSGFGTNGANNSPTVNPTLAIDPSKTALLPSQTTTLSALVLGGQNASSANFTNYSRGLNGIVVDLTGATNLAGINAASFQFATWSDFSGTTPNFVTVTPTVTVSTFAGGGASGADRIKLAFADNTIQESWLRVTVLANANTGLAASDVFYFGNARGDITPNASFPTQIGLNGLDLVQARANQLPSGAVVSNIYDVDKSGGVNGLDLVQVRARQGTNSLRPFTAPSSQAFLAASVPPITTKLSVKSLDSLFSGLNNNSM